MKNISLGRLERVKLRRTARTWAERPTGAALPASASVATLVSWICIRYTFQFAGYPAHSYFLRENILNKEIRRWQR